MKNGLRLNRDGMMSLIYDIDRVEMYDNPWLYFKAIRATLCALGFDESWVNGEFRDTLEKTYKGKRPGDVYNERKLGGDV